MTHTKIKNENVNAEGKVHQTEDYKIFKRIIGNRILDDRHINRLIKSMKKKDLMIPIIVNEKLEVVDGQHRLQARKELGIPVYYIVIDGMGLKETQEANINIQKWSPDNVMDAYVEQGYKHYKIYKQFKERYRFGHVETMIILSDNNNYGMTMNFRSGDFCVSDINKAELFAENMYRIEKYYKGFKRRSFVLAIRIALNNEKFDIEEFIKKLSYQSSKMVDCTNIDQYLHLIDEIYNFKKKIKDKVRFV